MTHGKPENGSGLKAAPVTSPKTPAPSPGSTPSSRKNSPPTTPLPRGKEWLPLTVPANNPKDEPAATD